jgi:geranylgeranyl pyrophosphate synthase
VTSLAAEPTAPPAKPKKPNTSAFKLVPDTRELRDRLRAEAVRFMQTVDRGKPLSKPALQAMGEELLAQMSLPTSYLGFTMVSLSNEFWREQLMAIDFKRRLFLLPHCLKHAEGCPADYDEFGLDCRKCGACSIADFRTKAEDLGYKVLVAEGSPIVLKIIVSGHVDGIVGVACLNVLEKAIDKILQVGVPSIAIPLLSSDCKNTSVDEDLVSQCIDLRTEPPNAKTKTYVHLMRAANQIFNGDMERLAPRSRKDEGQRKYEGGRIKDEKKTVGDSSFIVYPSSLNPLARTEEIAYDWLRQGGKRSRPFITLAAFDAMKGGLGTLAADQVNPSDTVRRVAMSIETFHKASLVHDDIEDDDTYRYGCETLHRQHGVATAINVGDYLIGLGYRLISRDRKDLGGECAADILNKLAEAHLRLSEGQGAELIWRDAADKALTPLDALKIYALKTAPAFEAALYAGVRLAGPAENYEKMVTEFSRHLGVAFQILNDLNDWAGDENNKLLAGQDVLAARPTLLLALALEAAAPEERRELLHILGDSARDRSTIQRVQAIFEQAQVFDKAEKLIDKYRARAEAVADEAEPVQLRELLYFLVDNVLAREAPEETELTNQNSPLLQIGGVSPSVNS